MGITMKEFLEAQRRIQLTYMEMPGLKLTRAQIRRLFNLSVEACETAIETLNDAGFLHESVDGMIGRGSRARTRVA